MSKNNLPAMPFYVGDWFKCPEVRALPPDYRGLWFDLLCFMWESTERGVMVKPSGKPYSDEDIVRMVGLDNQKSGFWLTYLLDNAVCYRRDDGAIYSKRMVKDEEIRQIRREFGKKGGNPLLLVNHILKSEVNLNTEYENEYENKDNIVLKEKSGVFKPPTLTEVLEYCKLRGNSVDSEKWHNFYSAKAWMIGKNKMKDWKASVRTWEKKEDSKKYLEGFN